MNKIAAFFVKIWRWLIWNDIETIHHVIKKTKAGEPVLDPEKKRIFIEGLKEAPKTIWKESWIWILVILFAGFMGGLVGMEYCEVKCNNFIIEEFSDCMGVRNITPGYVTQWDYPDLNLNSTSTKVTPSIPIS